MSHSHSHDHNNNTEHGHSHGHQQQQQQQPQQQQQQQQRQPGDNEPAPFQMSDKEELLEARHLMNVMRHMGNYQAYSLQRVQKLEKDFYNMHPRYLQPAINMRLDEKYDTMKNRIELNQLFIGDILKGSNDVFLAPNMNYRRIINEQKQDKYDAMLMGKVKMTLKQCYRDWSQEGKPERDQCYKPLLDKLEALFPDYKTRPGVSVLVPGSGLGRLVWECSKRNFTAQGNEFSYFMLLTSFTILNVLTMPNEAVLAPFVYETKNLLSFDDAFQILTIPDVAPNELPPTAGFSMTAGDWLQVYGNQKESWDAIVTCFFLDTAKNVIEYIEQIARLLKPGGYWLNIGPLLYHWADMEDEPSIELSYAEVKQVLTHYGLVLIEEKLHMECRYTSHPQTLHPVVYDSVYFVVQKPFSKKEVQKKNTAA